MSISRGFGLSTERRKKVQKSLTEGSFWELVSGRGEYKDFCDQDKEKLVEYFCSDGEAQTTEITCEFGCYLGLCRKTPI